MADREPEPEKEKPKKPKTRGDDTQGTNPTAASAAVRLESSEEPSDRYPTMDEATLTRVVTAVTQSVLDAFFQRDQANRAAGDGGHGGTAGPPAPRFFTPDYNQATQNFKRRMPSFELGSQPFEQFKLDFQLSADQSGFDKPQTGHPDFTELRDRRDKCLKGLLYQCLSAEAKALAGRRLYPTAEECDLLSLMQYMVKLQMLFEPPSESETARQEFLARVQHKDENPMLYLSDKITLFERAFAKPKRDFNLLSDTTTDGLYNDSLRMEMRKIVCSNEEEYGEKLAFHINAIRKSVVAGDLSEADAKGTHTYSTTSSYLSKKHSSTSTVKNEPGVHALNDRTRQPAAKKLLCYYCQKTGHFARDCSRKLSGLPAVKRDFGGVQAIVVDNDSDPPDTDYEDEVNALRNRRRVSFRDQPSRFSRNKPKRFNRRSVSQMSADETSDIEDEQFQDCESSHEILSGNTRSKSSNGQGQKGGGGQYTPPAARTGVQSMRDPKDDEGEEPIAPKAPNIAGVNEIHELDDDGILDFISSQEGFLDL